MKNSDLVNELRKHHPDIDVKVRVSVVIPDDVEDASEEDQSATDGDLLEIVEASSIYEGFGSLLIVADKIWEE